MALIFFVSICIFAQLKYPKTFSFIKNTVSHQGGITKNPLGHRAWNIGVIILGILIIPHFIRLFMIYGKISIIFSSIATIIGILSSISFCFVGIFPLEFKTLHFTFAGITFGGLFLMANIYLPLFIILRDKIGCPPYIQPSSLPNREEKKAKLKSRKIGFILVYLMFNGSFVLFSLAFILSGQIVPILEWIYLFMILAWFIISSH